MATGTGARHQVKAPNELSNSLGKLLVPGCWLAKQPVVVVSMKTPGAMTRKVAKAKLSAWQLSLSTSASVWPPFRLWRHSARKLQGAEIIVGSSISARSGDGRVYLIRSLAASVASVSSMTIATTTNVGLHVASELLGDCSEFWFQ